MQIALKKLEGLTNKEIAEELNYCERTIERKLDEHPEAVERTRARIRLSRCRAGGEYVEGRRV